jgi:hypothetical protein
MLDARRPQTPAAALDPSAPSRAERALFLVGVGLGIALITMALGGLFGLGFWASCLLLGF